jgi:hypothetical protein
MKRIQNCGERRELEERWRLTSVLRKIRRRFWVEKTRTTWNYGVRSSPTRVISGIAHFDLT